MDNPSDRPPRTTTLDELAAATDRVVATVTSLDDHALAEPSGLPGWTRGHVVAHLARNADGLGNLVTWADTGIETTMYASPDARSAAIEADAHRPATVQLDDLVASAHTLAHRLARMTTAADDVLLRMVSGAEIEGWQLVHLRLREVEIHHVDLAAGYGPTNWPPSFAPHTLDQVAPGFAAREGMPFGQLIDPDGRSWTVGDSPASLTGPTASVLGWLLGRADGSDLTPTGRDDVPPPLPWA
jgi:maleylpyruvate isomerase